MKDLIIQIDWEWALGILISLSSSLIAIAWYTSARLTRIETTLEWLKDILLELKVKADNASGPALAFGMGSPVNLKPLGFQWLSESGLKEYVDANREQLLPGVEGRSTSN